MGQWGEMAVARVARIAGALAVMCVVGALGLAAESARAGLLTPDPPPPPPAPPPTPAETELTLGPAKKGSWKIAFRENARLAGKLMGAAPSSDRLEVRLVASPFPYKEWATVDTFMVTPGKRFEFKARPRFNTRYRLAFDGDELNARSRSNKQQTYVYAGRDSKYEIDVGDRGLVKAVWRLDYSGRLKPDPLAGKTVHWYFGKTTSTRVRKVKSTKFHDIRNGGVRTTVNWKAPQGREAYRLRLVACVVTPPRDVGLGDTRPARCPRTIRLR